MLNAIFATLLLGAVVTAAFRDAMEPVTRAAIEAAGDAVELAVGLIGQMALWLGLVAILEQAGVLGALGRALRPAMTRLFPSVPPEHPAMSAMVLNILANVLGLGNAATPFGLKAMLELDRLNDRPGVATDAMALFLAINTSSVTLFPLRAVALRAELGARDVTGIVLPTLIVSACSTLTALAVAKRLQGLRRFDRGRYPPFERTGGAPVAGLDEAEARAARRPETSRWGLLVAWSILVLLGSALAMKIHRDLGAGGALFDLVKSVSSTWVLPVLVAAIVALGLARGVRLYEAFVEGAKGGFRVAITIIPYLVGMLVAIGMFRASGALDAVLAGLAPLTEWLGVPAAALPMALVRPLSGNGAYGVLVETLKTHGPDSFIGFATSIMDGSTETTFYVLAIYFGAVGVRAVRHTVFACLAADLVGPLMAIVVARWFY